MFSIINIIKDILFFTGSYSNEVFKDPLSKEEELECLEKLKFNDKEARNKLIEHNLRLVAHIAKKFDTTYVSLDDLISIGTIGLIKGIDTYSSSKGTKITTYVARCIENEILMYFRANSKTFKNISINDSVGYDKEGNEISILDVLKTDSPDFVEGISLKDNILLLNKYMQVLNKREKEIIIKRYGLFGSDEYTQKELAKELHISRSYVSRIEKRALTKMLKEFITHKNID